ncbi:MAG: hypothetical protein AVDCRST_MAG56-4726, partial [uncultured Cytophagales bacterium]
CAHRRSFPAGPSPCTAKAPLRMGAGMTWQRKRPPGQPD